MSRNRKAYSILVMYVPDEPGRKDLPSLVRHIADVSVDQGSLDLDLCEDIATGRAKDTAPEGYRLMATLVATKHDESNGYSATMAKVNYHVGYPGCPA